jgi:hypothetical protein
MPISDDFLRECYKDAQEQMRFRAETEYKLLQFLLIFYPIILAAMSTLFGSSISQTAYLLLSIGASIFILLITWFIRQKICAEHKNYSKVGEEVQQIWKYFKMFELGAYLENDSILPKELLDPENGYGKGLGHKKTLVIVWVITFAVILIILALGIFRDC